MSSDSEDSEYGPLEATCGSQAPAAISNKDNDDQPKGWDSLLDPNVKTKGDLGDGQLHRKGKNFKPIEEDFILAQRLNKPVPKKKMQAAIRETESKLGLPVSKKKPSASSRNKKKSSLAPITTSMDSTTHKFSTHSRMSSNNHRPQNHVKVPSTTRVPLASSEGDGSSWLQSPLVETPFWEQKKDNTTIAPPTPPSSSSSFITNNTNGQPPNTTYNNNRPPPAPVIKKKPPAKQKLDNAWGTSDASCNSVAKDVEPFSNTGWGDQTVTSTSSGWEEETKPLANSGWEGKENNSSGWGTQEASKSGRGETEKSKTAATTASGGGGRNEIEEEKKDTSSSNGWGSVNTAVADDGGWGSAPSNTTTNTTNINSSSNAIPSSRPSWLNTIPSHDNYNTQSTTRLSANGSRFSDRSRTKYSQNAPINIPKPVNYRPDQVTPIPVATAPPPPPENSHLVTINVELSERHKISVDIRELDEPLELAREFGRNNNIQSENVITALTKLFTNQKDLALKKKQQKLQRRVFSNPPPPQNSYQHHPSSYSQQQQQQQRPKYYNQHNSNVYTKSSYQEAPPPPPASFTRKDYY